MASHADPRNCQFWLAVERPAVVNRVAYYIGLVDNPSRDPSLTLSQRLNFRLFNARLLDKARVHLALGDRLHALRRLAETARAVAHPLPLALAVALEVWLAELERVAGDCAALGPIGADPGPAVSDETAGAFGHRPVFEQHRLQQRGSEY
jgi:hypothetical protein